MQTTAGYCQQPTNRRQGSNPVNRKCNRIRLDTVTFHLYGGFKGSIPHKEAKLAISVRSFPVVEGTV